MLPENAVIVGFLRQLAESWEAQERELQRDLARRRIAGDAEEHPQ